MNRGRELLILSIDCAVTINRGRAERSSTFLLCLACNSFIKILISIGFEEYDLCYGLAQSSFSKILMYFKVAEHFVTHVSSGF